MNNIHGIKDSANFTVKKKATGDVFLYADYATTSTNEWTADTVYALSKSTRAIRWDYNKQSTLAVSMEIFDLKWLSMLTGSDFITGSTNILAREVLTASGSNTITLTSDPVAGSLQVFLLQSDGISNGVEQTAGASTNPNEYTITSKVITLNSTTAPTGTKFVVYYLKASEATAQTMTIAADKFPFNVEIFADTMIRDTDGVDKFVQIHYLNAKAVSNFTITMSASEITTLEVTFDLFKDSGSENMATYTIL